MSKDRDRIRMTAEDAYVNAYLKAQDLLAGIEEYLQDFPAPTDDFQPHWGHVGDVQEINRMLEAVIDFLSADMKQR